MQVQAAVSELNNSRPKLLEATRTRRLRAALLRALTFQGKEPMLSPPASVTTSPGGPPAGATPSHAAAASGIHRDPPQREVAAASVTMGFPQTASLPAVGSLAVRCARAQSIMAAGAGAGVSAGVSAGVVTSGGGEAAFGWQGDAANGSASTPLFVRGSKGDGDWDVSSRSHHWSDPSVTSSSMSCLSTSAVQVVPPSICSGSGHLPRPPPQADVSRGTATARPSTSRPSSRAIAGSLGNATSNGIGVMQAPGGESLNRGAVSGSGHSLPRDSLFAFRNPLRRR
jgi:hypothetical protein